MNGVTLRDPDIRAPLLAAIAARGSISVTEFTVHEARADVVEITDKDLIAYEIKSDVDTNKRLEKQSNEYDRVCTFMYLVTTPKKLPKMMPLIPPWWGIILAYEETSGVVLREYRDARPNLTWNLLDALQLLWQEELTAVLKRYTLPLRADKPRRVRAKRVASSLGEAEAKTAWLQALRERYERYPELRGPGKRAVSTY